MVWVQGQLLELWGGWVKGQLLELWDGQGTGSVVRVVGWSVTAKVSCWSCGVVGDWVSC